MPAPKPVAALVFGKPVKAPSPAGPAPEDSNEELVELAKMAFPGAKVDVDALKEFIHACIDKGYDE